MMMIDEDKYRPPSTDAPWLIITHENDTELLAEQTFCTMSPTNESYVKTIPVLDGKSILGSCLGWLILQKRQNKRMYSIWNPVTLESICLPELVDAPNDEQPTSVVITSDTDSIDRPVLLLFFVNLVFYCRPSTGDDCRWIKQSLKYDGSSVCIAMAITLNGEIYAYAHKLEESGGYTKSFARVKFTNDGSNTLLLEPNLIEAPSVDFEVYPFTRDYLVEADGVLYAVHRKSRDMMYSNELYKAFVWRLDLIRMKWIRVKSLGDRAFLLGDSCSTWCWPCTSHSNSSGIRIQRNCIYFTTLSCSTVYSYRLQDDSYTFLLPHSSFRGSFNGPTWFIKNRNNTRFLTIQVKQIKQVEKAQYKKDPKGTMNTKLSSNRLLSQLPDDMIRSIAKRLHLFDYMNFRHISKAFYSKLPRLKMRYDCSRPLFFSLKTTKGICEIRDPYSTTSYIIRTPVYSYLTTIEFCNNGWLLFRSKGICLDYSNLFTCETGYYPFSSMMFGNASYGFSTCPNSPGCLTVGIQNLGITGVSIDIFQHGNTQWDNHVFNDIEFQANYNSSPKYYNGAFYFIDSEGKIGVLKMIEEKWSWKVYHGPLTQEERASLNSCYLVDVKGELICVFIQQLGKSVQIFKFDIVDQFWVKLNNLGDHVLFLSAASSFSVFEKDSTMNNRIYLPKRMNNRVVYYSLCTCKYHISSTEASFDDFHGMIGQSICCWI